MMVGYVAAEMKTDWLTTLMWVVNGYVDFMARPPPVIPCFQI